MINIAHAALRVPTSLVPCGTSATGNVQCTPCHLWLLAYNIINFILWLSLPILVIVLLYGGILWLISAGNASKVEQGKTIIWNALIGILIAFLGWLIVDSIIKTLAANKPVAAWNTPPTCEQAIVTTPPPVVPPPVVPPPVVPPPAGGTLTDADARKQLTDACGGTLSASCINITSTGNCSDKNNPKCTSLDGIQQQTINNIISFKNDCGCAVTMTAGTEFGHSTTGTCTHASGCKIDIAPFGSTSAYIRSHFTSQAPTFGVEQYKDPKTGAIYTLEQNPLHWDIALR